MRQDIKQKFYGFIPLFISLIFLFIIICIMISDVLIGANVEWVFFIVGLIVSLLLYGIMFLLVKRDFSKEKRNHRFVNLQYEITKVISESTNFARCMREIIRIIGETMELDVGTLWQEDPEKQVLKCQNIWSQQDPLMRVFADSTETFTFKLNEGLPGRVWQEKKTLVINNIDEIRNFTRAPLAKAAALKSAFAFPLFYEDQIVGIFEFLSKQENHFEEIEISKFAEWLGRLFGILLIRNKVEDSLQTSEENLYQISLRLKLATESAWIGIWDWNLKTNELLWDDMMFHVYGEPPSVMIKPYEYWLNHVHPEDRAKTESELQDGVNGKKQFNTVFRIIWKNQAIHYIRAIANVIIDDSGVPIKMVGVNWDVTEEKTAENRLRMMIESSPNAMILINRESSIVFINHQTEKLFGYVREELIGQKIEILIPEKYREKHLEHVKEYHEDPSIRPMGAAKEVFGLKKNGEHVPLDIALSPIKTLEGELVIASITDITEQKKAELMKNEFVSMVSHELRTPLTSIQGALGLIVEEELSEKSKKLITIAYSNGERLLRLINDLLDIEKINLNMMVFEPETIDLRVLIKHSIESNKNYASQFDVTLSYHDGLDPLPVFADPDRIMQVLTNLISNAVKFSPEDGQVMISSEVRDNDYVRISVKDNGPGVAEEFKQRIFQKFAQADSSNTRKKGGTGLGLSICKGIIEKQGGIIDYESVAGQGATFYFELPLQKETSKNGEERL